jgi:hypothetical protein
MALVLFNPFSFFFHIGEDLIVNGVRIYKDISYSITQYDAGHFELMGEGIGDALAKLLIGGAVEKQEAWRVKQATNIQNLNLF